MAASAPLAERTWVTPLVRAALAVATGVAITFIPDHSAALGLTVFGIWATVAGVVLGALALRLLSGVNRTLFLLNGVVTAVAGLLALMLLGAGLPVYLYLVSVWAAVTGFVELYAGIRERSAAARAGTTSPIAREWIAAGAFTALLSLAYLLLPPNPVVAIGLLGAYLVILGVYLAIAGFSLRWDERRTPATEPEEVP